MASLLEFVERVRTLQDLPLTGAIDLGGTNPDDSEHCILAKALGAPVRSVDAPGAGHAVWDFALLVKDRLMARRIGIVMDLEWCPEPPAVRLPPELVDLAVSQHRGRAEVGELGFLRGWWVPIDESEKQWRYLTPVDDLIDGGHWALPTLGPRRSSHP